MANNATSTTRTGQVPTQPGGGLTCNSGGRPINGGGTDGMNWPAMIARYSSSWPLPALKASHALSGSKKTPIGLAANSREESCFPP